MPPKKALTILDLVRPYRVGLSLAFVAVLGETLASLLDPWPIKVVVDNLLKSKPLPGTLGRLVTTVFGQGPYAILNFAVAAVAVVAILGAVSAYFEKYLTTSVSQWVGHDLRRTLYHHIQRLSLADHDKTRSGDLITRVTERHRRHPGLHRLRAARHPRQRVDARRHDRGHVLAQLAVYPHRPVGDAGAVRGGLPLHPADQESLARRSQEGRRPAVDRRRRCSTSIRVVKAFAREDYEQQRFDAESLANVEAGLEARSLKARLAPVVDVIVAARHCLVLWYGARLALAGAISAGMLIVFLSIWARCTSRCAICRR